MPARLPNNSPHALPCECFSRPVLLPRLMKRTGCAGLRTDPQLAAFVEFFLPDRHGFLQLINGVVARLERRMSVARRDGNRHTGFADIHPAEAMDHGDFNDWPARKHCGGNLTHFLLSHTRVTLIFQADYLASVVSVPRSSHKRRHRASPRVRDEVGQFSHVDWGRGELTQNALLKIGHRDQSTLDK